MPTLAPMAQLRAIAPLLLASSLVPSARAEDTVATPTSADEVHVMRVGPGCLGGQWNSVNVAGALFDPLARGRGSYVITSVSESAIERAPSDASIEGGAWLFPEAAHVTDAARVVRVVGPEKGGAALTREVIDDALPILIGPQDMAFQWPRAGHTDVLAISSRTRLGAPGASPI